MADFIYDRLIIDGKQYDYLPSNIEEMSGNGYGLRSESFPTLGMNRIVVTQTRVDTAAHPYAHLRVMASQSWRLPFDQESWMTLEMYDHLKFLHDSQKGFWVQYDDEMSRYGAELNTTDPGYKAYMTPTWPIVPYGYTPPAETSHVNNISVNGIAQTTGFTVDNELGIVIFDTARNPSDKIRMNYTWKAFVRIAEFDVKVGQIAHNTYSGNVVLEQLPAVYTNERWLGS